MKVYEICSANGIDALHLAERATPSPGPGQVLVRMRANSINYRDLLNILDPPARGIAYPRIPNSDGAGDVVEVGEEVTRFRAGDRVVEPLRMPGNTSVRTHATGGTSGFGGAAPGY